MKPQLKREFLIHSPRRLDQRDKGVVFNFESTQIGDWCLELSMLCLGLVQFLETRDLETGVVLEICAGVRQDRSVASRRGKRWDYHPLQDDLMTILGFFLQYHRDGRAPGPLLDLEAHDPVAHRSVSLVFKVGRFVTPPTFDQFRKTQDYKRIFGDLLSEED